MNKKKEHFDYIRYLSGGLEEVIRKIVIEKKRCVASEVDSHIIRFFYDSGEYFDYDLNKLNIGDINLLLDYLNFFLEEFEEKKTKS